jgi:hypothetical protein
VVLHRLHFTDFCQVHRGLLLVFAIRVNAECLPELADRRAGAEIAYSIALVPARGGFRIL